ncbi:hypothetical protein DFJ74DRAFT_142757 [Hyaloraphidium curvatum]|nr:hypothetical protein DFJ74DRAFT_142757 [Hyaloraphidium curvatum]
MDASRSPPWLLTAQLLHGEYVRTRPIAVRPSARPAATNATATHRQPPAAAMLPLSAPRVRALGRASAPRLSRCKSSRAPRDAPPPTALDSFAHLFRSSRFAAVDGKLALGQTYQIPDPPPGASDAQLAEWDARKDRGDFGFKREFGAVAPASPLMAPLPRPYDPNPQTGPEFLPVPRLVSPRMAQRPIFPPVEPKPAAQFDTADDRAAEWVPATPLADRLARWNELVPPQAAADLGGTYRDVRFEEPKELPDLSEADFSALLAAARSPAVRRRFRQWIRDGMPPLDTYTASENPRPLPDYAVPPGAARTFALSLLPQPRATGPRVHPPSFLFHLRPETKPATPPADDAAARARPTFGIRALLEPKLAATAAPVVPARVLNADAAGAVFGAAGFAGSAPAPPGTRDGPGARFALVEVELEKAYWVDGDTVHVEGRIKEGRRGPKGPRPGGRGLTYGSSYTQGDYRSGR